VALKRWVISFWRSRDKIASLSIILRQCAEVLLRIGWKYLQRRKWHRPAPCMQNIAKYAFLKLDFGGRTLDDVD
jgi:hypothetical protein